MHSLRPIFIAAVLGALGLALTTPAEAQMKIPPQSFQEVVDRAEERQTPILVEVYAPWCPHCARMQKQVYSDSTVRSYLEENFTYVRLNSDTTGGSHKINGRTVTTSQLASVFGTRGVPNTVFLKPDGSPIARQPGFIDRSMFLTMIRYVGSGAYEDQSYKEYAGR